MSLPQSEYDAMVASGRVEPDVLYLVAPDEGWGFGSMDDGVVRVAADCGCVVAVTLEEPALSRDEVERGCDRNDAEVTRVELLTPCPLHHRVEETGLQIRLSDAEMAALDEIASGRDLKVSTLAREQLLKLLAPEPSIPLLVQVSRLEEAAHALRNRLVHDPAYQGLLTPDDFAEARTLPPY